MTGRAPHRAGAPAGAPAGAGAAPNAEPARARVDALTHWCLSDRPLAPAVARALPGSRATLGDLLRRALARDGAGVVDLLDALDAVDASGARAAGAPAGVDALAARDLVARVLGGDVLLVVLTVADGAAARADVRACRTLGDARALVNATLGALTDAWVADFGVAEFDGAAGQTLAPALWVGVSGAALGAPVAPLALYAPSGAALRTVVLPFLSLAHVPGEGDDGAAAAPAPAPAVPAVLGGTFRAGSAFLDGPAVERPAVPAAPAAPAARTDPRDASDADDDQEFDDGDDEDDEDAPEEDARDPGDAAAARPPAAAVAFAPPPPRPDPELAPGDRELALERLRARAGATRDRVPVLIAVDDGTAEHVADAGPWLAAATDAELRAVAGGGWRGADALDVALALADDDPEAAEVVQLARRHEAELVVEIDAAAAGRWLARHRPDVAGALDGDEDGESDPDEAD